MAHPFNAFQWFYPPRSSTRMPYSSSPVMNMWRRFPDAIAQLKMNGSNDMVVVYPDQHIENWSRHKIDPRTKKSSSSGNPKLLDWKMPSALRDEVISFTPKGKFTIYNAELIHAKTTDIKNTLYFFDVLVWDGEHLIGKDYRSRYDILSATLGHRYMPLNIKRADGEIFVAENIRPESWDSAWVDAQKPSYTEGLILKRIGSSSSLQVGNVEKNNGGFMCKIRKPTKNALF